MDYLYLPRIDSPADLKKVPREDLPLVAAEVRDYLINVVSRVGGHLASSLGATELTIALHYVFDTPRDKIVWDVGHQAYVHKILTGRRDRLPTIRQYGGLSGFPVRDESPYDTFNVAHAGTAISGALGMAAARDLKGEDYHVVAVVGDAGLTVGMELEAINNLGALQKKVLVIINDNTMSISPNVGALAGYMNRIIHGQAYHRLKEEVEKMMLALPKVGPRLHKMAKDVVESAKTLLIPGLVFEELGFDYVGPVNGHHLIELTDTLTRLKDNPRPTVMHVVTQKGKGYPHAESLPTKFHGVTTFDISTGAFHKAPASAPTYTGVFGKAMCELAEKDRRIIGITAAMSEGTGLDEFARKFPDRFFDVGIAEQHAVTFAVGLALEGLKPVAAIYSTFLQRAYDQVYHDACLMRAPVVFAMDRGGIAGADGPTHHGLYDIAYMCALPNIVVMAPKDENELRHMLYTALHVGGPASLRYPRGNGVGVTLDPEFKQLEIGKAEIMREGSDFAILALGSMVYPSLAAAEKLAPMGLNATVINARFAKPLDDALICCLAAEKQFLVTVEEGTECGGFGAHVAALLQDRKIPTSILRIALPDRVIPHGAPNLLHAKYGLDADGIVERIKAYANECPMRAELKYRSLLHP
jgi:1-deoxy-D-xylulose-5-phosphate synthase